MQCTHVVKGQSWKRTVIAMSRRAQMGNKSNAQRAQALLTGWPEAGRSIKPSRKSTRRNCFETQPRNDSRKESSLFHMDLSSCSLAKARSQIQCQALTTPLQAFGAAFVTILKRFLCESAKIKMKFESEMQGSDIAMRPSHSRSQ